MTTGLKALNTTIPTKKISSILYCRRFSTTVELLHVLQGARAMAASITKLSVVST
jgi:hypothetical protein